LAERVVKVKLQAIVDEYTKGMREAAAETRAVGTQAEKLAQVRQSMQLLGTAGVAMGAALAAGVGIAVAKFAEFDQAMSNVQAVSHASSEEIGQLRQAALDLGASTVFSATEAAGAIEELAKAGVSTADILNGGLAGALDLAAAGGLDVAEAAGIAATTLQQFRLEGSDASHVADLLAAGAGKAMGDVTDMSAALAQGGLVANQFGLSVDETVGTLSAFASAGLLGSDAGTSFRTMLLRLANPTGEAAETMKSLGINAYDAQGRFVGMSSLAGQLEDSMKGLSQEQRNASLAIIFGQDAIRGANVLLAEGKSGIEDWTDAVNDQGYAAETAAARLDNLIGDWEQFTGALDTAMITMGEAADGPLRSLVQWLTQLVDGFSDLPDWAQQLGLGMAAAASGVGLLGGGVLLAIPKVNDLREALNGLGRDGDKIVGKLGKFATIGSGFAVGFAAAAVGLDMLTKAMESMGDAAEVTDNKLVSASDAAEVLNAGLGKGFGSTDDIELAQEAVESLAEMLDLAASGAQATGDSILGVATAAEAVAKLGTELGDLAETNLPAAQQKFRLLAEEGNLTEKQMSQLLDLMGPYKTALTEQASKNGEAADKQTLLNLAMGEGDSVAESSTVTYLEQADAVSELESQFQALLEAIDAANGMNRDAVTANIDYQNTLRDVEDQIRSITEGAEGFGRGLDITTKAGADNKAMLVGLSQDAWDAATAQLALDGNTAAFSATLETQRQKLYDSAIQMGASEEEAANLRDTLLAMPDAKTIQVLAETQSAEDKLRILRERLDGIPAYKSVTLETITLTNNRTISAPQANGGFYQRGQYANSGFEPGIYPYTAGGIDKFAEQYAEAYISLDPARRARSESVWVKTGQELGMFSGSDGSSQPPVVYVQNPFTGEYLLAQVASVADGRIGSYDRASAQTTRRGVRSI
jgi:TP901 family phage tail tape measure protein